MSKYSITKIFSLLDKSHMETRFIHLDMLKCLRLRSIKVSIKDNNYKLFNSKGIS